MDSIPGSIIKIRRGHDPTYLGSMRLRLAGGRFLCRWRRISCGLRDISQYQPHYIRVSCLTGPGLGAIVVSQAPLAHLPDSTTGETAELSRQHSGLALAGYGCQAAGMKRSLLNCGIAACLTLALFLPGSGPAVAQEPRTLIDRYEFSTPSEATVTFIDAWRSRDYFGVWFMLSADAKKGFNETWQRSFHARALFPGLTVNIVPGRYFDLDRPLEDEDGLALDSGRLFDDIMYGADRLLVMPFRLSAGTEIISIAENGQGATATLRTENRPEILTVELVRAGEAGPWRIDRIQWEGSSPTLRPWGVEIRD